MIQYFEEKEAKEKLERKKIERKEERERKRKEHEAEKERKRLERERKKIERKRQSALKLRSTRGRGRGSRRGGRSGRGRGNVARGKGAAMDTELKGRTGSREKGKVSEDIDSAEEASDSFDSDDTSSSVLNSSDDYQCTICEMTGGNWIACDSCDKWYHQKCVGIASPSDLGDWFCAECEA